MSRIMYDSTRAQRIKNNLNNPAMVAGYVDEYSIPKWTAAEWNMFPNAVKVRIAKKASTNDGHVLDVEEGLATAAQAPVWTAMRRKAGLATPTIYVQKSRWQEVQNAFNAAKVPHPLYWIAHYNGVSELPTLNGIKAIAKQYLGDTNGMDYSFVAEFWPGVDSAPPTYPAIKQGDLDMTDVAPITLPYSGAEPHASDDGWAQAVWPIEVGSNSSLISAQWLVLNSAWGDTQYEIIIMKNGTLVSPAAVSPANTSMTGTLHDRERIVVALPDGCDGVALRWKNNGSWVRAGIAFPQRTK
jgi:hypothetical protein